MIVYFLIAIIATTAGALTGMGGGVIIKPILDMMQGYDVSTIGVLSAVTVFAMSISSLCKQLAAKNPVPVKLAVPLASGAVVGGLAGQVLLDVIVGGMDGNVVTIIQNAILCGLILIVFCYMRCKERFPSPAFTGLVPAIAVGLILGLISSFLGIGGGPINVAVLIYCFSLTTKSAALCSIFVILFSQASKLLTVAVGTGFAVYDLKMLPAMVIGGVAGGLIGSALSKRFSEKTVEFWFNVIQIVVLILAAVNIVRNI